MAVEPKIVRELRAAKPHKRAQILKRQHRRNVAFLEKKFPELAQYVSRVGIGRFQVEPDGALVAVTDKTAGTLLHPPGKLAEFASQLGEVNHGGWWEYQLSATRISETIETEHQRIVQDWVDQLEGLVPDMTETGAQTRFVLPASDKARVFSPLVFFLGLNTGLHIEYYLTRARVQDLVLLEPDPERFALSCLFLDYAALHERLGHLYLFVGEADTDRVLGTVSAAFPLSSQVWVRMLRGYDAPEFTLFADRARLHFRKNTYLPMDRQLRGMDSAVRNLQGKRAIWSDDRRGLGDVPVAVIGAGPSLDDAIEWLKRYRDRMVIVCAVSAVRALRAAGLRPDFQCALDYEYPETTLERLELDTDVPLIASINASSSLLDRFDTPLLFAEAATPNIASFPLTWRHTGPTSGNLALAAALRFGASEVYLAGLDFAFPKEDRSHATGTLHGFRQSGEDTGAPLLQTNHPASEEGAWVSTPYLNNARQSAEIAIADTDIPVRNLSHGALIEGAIPDYPENIELPPVAGLAECLEKICAGFGSDVPCRPFSTCPCELLDRLRKPLQELPGSLDWVSFVAGLDRYWCDVSDPIVRRDPEDRRLEVFASLMRHILLRWYQLMLRAPAAAQADLYREGRRRLLELATSLEWPESAERYMRERCDHGAEETNLDHP
ncbi:6-hydroxymethylpterin diphosphokinase MptE-like protein [Thioalkalivibrio sp. AKL6]|uniref:motility associated factor glycosyltransferase family protein n=1 Tax=Thioalkalivibrio sp. AKL6 TaxID=1158154 RepID=UPI0003772F46|nr:6-hydroxymethylpterin diphosphokinase MptE-like protein [Thioalkalivibrio sp. AKL6]